MPLSLLPARRKRESKPPAALNTLPAVRRQGGAVDTLVSAFESETAAVMARTQPRTEHPVLYVLIGMVVLGIVLISVTKLDRVVSGVGTIITTGGSLYVSPLDKSIIRDVRVKAGDVVRKGQPLATLDPTFTSADLEQLQLKLASDDAEVARLQSEQDDKPYVPAANSSYAALQTAIYRQRISEYRESLTDFDARIKNAQAALSQYQRDAAEYGKRLKLAGELEDMNMTLQQHGWGSKLRTLTSTDARLEIGRQLADSENLVVANRETVSSLQAQRAAFIEKWHSDTGKELVLSRNDLDKTRDDLAKAQKMSQLVSLDAPADAVVLKIGKISTNSVVDTSTQTEPLFTLVPLDAPVEAEVNVDASDIGFIQPNDPVEVKIDAYRFLQHGTAKGVIKSISEGSFTTDENNTPVSPYFKVGIGFTEVHLHNVPSTFRLVPGMTVVGDIKVGRRTILSYLVEGAMRTGSEAMREP
jgi:hemolysin D